MEKESLYKYRSSNKMQYGPYGVLIGDLTFNALVGQDHYLRKGEKKFGYALLDDFIKVTKPCIVKFETATSELNHLIAALSCVYELEQPKPSLWLHNSDCFCGHGDGVSPVQIQKVLFLEDSADSS
jgi:hypothetical protein